MKADAWVMGPPLIVLTIIGAILYWLLLCYVVAHAGGWARLVERYATRLSRPKAALRRQSLRAGRCSYRSSVTIAALPEGLYLATALFFRPNHPPVLVPWSAAIGCQHIELARGPVLEITFEAFPVPVSLQLPLDLAVHLQISNYLGEFSPPTG
jgi:hypothetical protein